MVMPHPRHAHEIMSGPKVGSIWEERYRVLGQSAVWGDMVVCELLTGPNRGEKVVLGKSQFSSSPRVLGDGKPLRGLVPARERRSERSKENA